MPKVNKKGLIFVAVGIFSISVMAGIYSYEPPEFLSGLSNLATNKVTKAYYSSFLNEYDPDPIWEPSEKFNLATQPEINGAAGMLVELNSGKILAEKNAHEKRPIASLVKVMTAVVVLEHKDIKDQVKITSSAAEIGENSMSLDAGEVYTVEELLYGLIMNSGNDAAYALAQATAGNDKDFVEWMNIKAHELGLRDTYFADPSGLDDGSYSTPADLIKLTRYALKDPTFRKITNTLETELYGNEHKYLYLYNQTNLLSTYPGVQGVKTGYTEDAGLCLITYAENNGVELVGVVLNSIDRKGDMILMLDHGFSSFGVSIEHFLF